MQNSSTIHHPGLVVPDSTATPASAWRDERRPLLQRVLFFAAEQEHVIDWRQMRDLGVTRPQLRAWQRKGLLEHRHRNVWVVTGSPQTWHQHLVAACLTLEAVASHRSAGQLLDVRTWREEPVEVMVGRLQRPEIEGIIVHQTMDLDARHVTMVGSIPVTTIERTLVDLGAVIPKTLVERSLERAIQLGLTEPSAVLAIVDDVGRKGRAGAGVMREILGERCPVSSGAQSVLEVEFLRLCSEYAIPAPVCQHEVRLPTRTCFLDHAWPDIKFAVEVQGFEHHGVRERYIDDCRRTTDLQIAGWTVQWVTADDIRLMPQATASRVQRNIDRLTARPPVFS